MLGKDSALLFGSLLPKEPLHSEEIEKLKAYKKNYRNKEEAAVALKLAQMLSKDLRNGDDLIDATAIYCDIIKSAVTTDKQKDEATNSIEVLMSAVDQHKRIPVDMVYNYACYLELRGRYHEAFLVYVNAIRVEDEEAQKRAVAILEENRIPRHLVVEDVVGTCFDLLREGETPPELYNAAKKALLRFKQQGIVSACTYYDKYQKLYPGEKFTFRSVPETKIESHSEAESSLAAVTSLAGTKRPRTDEFVGIKTCLTFNDESENSLDSSSATKRLCNISR